MKMVRTNSATPGTGSSAYLNALTYEIEKKLQRAVASPTQRRNLLQELFADIALEVDDRARGKKMQFLLWMLMANCAFSTCSLIIMFGYLRVGNKSFI